MACVSVGRPPGFAFSVDEESGERGGVLVAIDLVPRPATEGGALDLELQPGPMEADLLHTSLRREGDAAAIPTP